MNEKTKKFTLLLGDIFILYAGLYLTLLLRYQKLPDIGTWQTHIVPFSTTFVAWILIFYIANLYNLHLAINNAKVFNLTIKAIFISGLLSTAYFYINPNINIAPKTNLIIFLAISASLVIFWRRIFNWLLYSYTPKNNVAVVGYNGKVNELKKTFQEKPQLGYNLALIIDENKSPEEIQSEIINKKVTSIILAQDPHDSPALRQVLFSCLPLKINFISLTNFYEMITGKVPIDSINQMWFLENLNEGNKKGFDLAKRTYDLILASLLFVLTLPFWTIVAIIIKLESKGPIFIKMKRCGQDDTIFTMLKFRSMREEGNNRGMTIKNDPRITRFGNFMRKTRIDEIPQVINILRGEMSFVGPRPERPELARELEKQIPFFRERTLVKPGISGWDQISGEYHSPSLEDTLKKLQYDLFYIKNRSIYLDLSIILKTIATVVSRSGR